MGALETRGNVGDAAFEDTAVAKRPIPDTPIQGSQSWEPVLTQSIGPGLISVGCGRVPITSCTRAEAAREVVRLATSKTEEGVDVHLCNAYTLALADEQPEFRLMLQRGKLNFPDGQSVVWANRLLHRGQNLSKERIYGPDLFLDVLETGQTHGVRHYLLGSTPDVLADLEKELRRRFPGADIVGAESPPFRPLSAAESREQVDRIASSEAQVVWVGLGTPKQDWEAARLAQVVPAVFCAVGAAFDFVAGHKKQAPAWMQEHGLEWMFRLLSEPKRLWRRYLFGNARFVWSVARTFRS